MLFCVFYPVPTSLMKLHKLLLAGVLALGSFTAFANTWPNRPIRFIVAAPGGSSLDLIARTLGDKLKERLGQPVVVENIPGASGTIASGNVARAAPDGHTLLLSYNGPLAYTQYLTALPYDPQKDLAPVVQTSAQPNVLVVSSNLPVKSVAELIAFAKARPGKLNYASVGNGSSSHLSTELFKTKAGVYVVHIPYNGAPPAALSVASGDTQMLFSVPSVVMPHLRSGKVRALAVTGAQRFSLMPDLPTVAESGLPGFEAITWNGIMVPAGTPTEVIHRLNGEVNAILHLPEVKARLNSGGLEPTGGSPEQFKALIAAEARKWSDIIRRTGAKLD